MNDITDNLDDDIYLTESDSDSNSDECIELEKSQPIQTNQQLIMEINRDKTLSTQEKTNKIRDIMLGKFKNVEEIKLPDCTHYKKLCTKFYFTCCNKTYDCCRCHNQAELCKGPIVINNITCSNCQLKQVPSNMCIGCAKKFSRSHCEICNIWSEKNIYHCVKCGLCRIGSVDKYFHCDNCQCCFKKSSQDAHHCTTILSTNTQCVLCLETAATTSQYHLTVLQCKHPVHTECLTNALRNNNYKCPLCRKSMINMQYSWSILDQEILLHPLPDEAKRKINIICYDCETKSENVDWHFFGCKCLGCGSYNTSSI